MRHSTPVRFSVLPDAGTPRKRRRLEKWQHNDDVYVIRLPLAAGLAVPEARRRGECYLGVAGSPA